jgi:nucleoside-diphosphate-sugar epimerase
MRVLVTGGAGYVGSVLSRMLLEEGYDVTILDRFFFGRQSVEEIADQARLVKGDIRWVKRSVMSGVDAVIDMAALSNDPVGELNPAVTLEINHRARVRVAKLAKKSGVGRYLLASSASVYGLKKEVCTERTRVHPLTTYAKANVLWENDTLPLANRRFCVTALRQSSVYGISKRMRFDIAFNNMVLSLFKGEKLPIMRDGTQRRPIIHIQDTCRAFISVLNADPEVVAGQVFNSGSNDQNYQIFELARMAARSVGVPFRYEWYGSPDFRSYTVNFDKIRTTLAFKPKFAPKDGAREVFNGLRRGTIASDEKSVTIQWYKRLQEIQELVKDVELRGRIL